MLLVNLRDSCNPALQKQHCIVWFVQGWQIIMANNYNTSQTTWLFFKFYMILVRKRCIYLEINCVHSQTDSREIAVDLEIDIRRPQEVPRQKNKTTQQFLYDGAEKTIHSRPSDLQQGIPPLPRTLMSTVAWRAFCLKNWKSYLMLNIRGLLGPGRCMRSIYFTFFCY